MRRPARATRVPRAVRELADEVEAAVHAAPTVRFQNGRWRLALASDRVSVTVDWKSTSAGRWVWAGSVLIVDGERRPIADSVDHFARIFRDPDRTDWSPPPLVEPLAEQPVDTAPPLVQGMVRKLTDALPDGCEVSVATYGLPDLWTIQIKTSDTTLRANYRICTDCDELETDGDDWLQVVVDGVDRSAEVAGSLSRALAMMRRPAHDAAPGPAAVAKAAPAARNTSVEVRRASVIRT